MNKTGFNELVIALSTMSAKPTSARPSSARPSSAIRQSPKSKRDTTGPEAQELIAKARNVGNKISGDEHKTRRLLRAMYNAEQSVNHPSLKESLVQFYLRTKVMHFILHILIAL